MRSFFLICLLLIISGLSPVIAQDESIAYPSVEINIDSIIQDSLRKAFILNHRPLTKKEKTAISFNKEISAYGSYANANLKTVQWYSLDIPKGGLYSPMILRPNLEWIFYSFLFLFLFTAFLGRYSNGLLRKLWKIYINDGFIYRQSKDQMSQQPIISIALNFLFIFSSGFFIFFGLQWDDKFIGNTRWLILFSSFLVIAFIYLFKNIFFKLLGWAFRQEQAIDDYLFVVFLNNKVTGLILLFSSFIMAFSNTSSSSLTFRIALFLVGMMLIYRFVRGYQVFSKQSQIGFFTLFLSFIALELIPTAVLIKFITNSVSIYLDNIL
ncbi:MAG: hypothetical protein RL000_746 [Bacteroidota bacterium]